MATLIVPVTQISAILPHPNAEKLEIAIVDGWQVCVPKAQFAFGDTVTFIPPDAVLPQELADSLGVTKYLGTGMRVRPTTLRGEPSLGIITKPFGQLGENVAEKLGITKWIPPANLSAGDWEPQDPLFTPYTDIENLRNFSTGILEDGEEVIVTEKIHGTNSRIGGISTTGDNPSVRLVVGSKTQQRSKDGLYGFPLTLPAIKDYFTFSTNDGDHGWTGQIILYGEIYGKVQNLRYGLNTSYGFRAFDIKRNEQYLDYDRFLAECKWYEIDTVPELYRGPYSLDKIKELAEGMSTLPGANNIREGVVVRPVKERRHPKIGRVILKYVGNGYLGKDTGETEQGE